jgi:hypothetical protein
MVIGATTMTNSDFLAELLGDLRYRCFFLFSVHLDRFLCRSTTATKRARSQAGSK